jgi:P27 family predicted phage terminase small subunit
MPTPPKRLENQTKHLTNREKAIRRQAENGLARGTRVQLRAPKGMSEEARKIWDRLKRNLRGLDMLDNLDADLLAVYCIEKARYEWLVKQLALLPSDEDLVKEKQAQVRLIKSLSAELGLSPNARARLAKKKAEAEPPDDLELLLDDVSDYVNGGQ